ncbi:hypothetical protein PLICRDRAFT_147481 [Plicaturopsis crispa FD-325 SS-3]|uniref:Enoyl reductase (ER) domain-containing protein n=1 Tax=Plicaturopsis crispa FD-325 SS-3 TaxID=944288 RepID=A0A0C9SX79_PLICR|nr:hypothetical protein PLICRDRAFT_147481 [Plicaturopsis crispa FD-325 SS-3]
MPSNFLSPTEPLLIMRAVKIQPGKTVAVEEVPTPTLLHSQLLVKVAAVAINPTDWKHVERGLGGGPGSTVGCDLAGTVEKAGPHSRFVPGDRIAAFVHGSSKNDPTTGAFAEYAAVDEHVAFKLPAGMSFEEAASLPVALVTTSLAFNDLGIPASLEPVKRGEPILVYGGATSVSQVFIQLAKALGFEVITTASEKNREYLTKLGADHVIDYHDADKCIAGIKAALNGRALKLAHDGISEGSSLSIVFSSVTPSLETKVTLVLFNVPSDIPSGVTVTTPLAYLALGRAADFRGMHFPASPELVQAQAEFTLLEEKALAAGIVKPQEIRQLPGGLEGIKDALALLKESGGSRAKLVLTIA